MFNKCLLLIILIILISPSVSAMIIVAQNDTMDINMINTGGTCWFFNQQQAQVDPTLLDIPSHRFGLNASCYLNNTQTGLMQEGQWDLLYTYPAKINGMNLKDITYQNGKLESIFANDTDIDEHGQIATKVEQDLKNAVKNDKIDGMETYIIDLSHPYININRLDSPGNSSVVIAGVSNLVDGTPVTIVVDQAQHLPQGDLSSFTFTTYVIRPDTTATGYWEKGMVLPLQDMAVGWHDIDVYVNGMDTTVKFPITESWDNTPPPAQAIHYFSNGSIQPEIIYRNITTIVTVQQPAQSVYITQTPTPTPTDALGESISITDRSDNIFDNVYKFLMERL